MRNLVPFALRAFAPLLAFLLAAFAAHGILVAQVSIDVSRIVSTAGATFPSRQNGPPATGGTAARGDLAPQLGVAFTIVPGLGGIAPDEPGAGSAFFAGLQGTVETGMVENPILDGFADVVGRDFADMIDPDAIPSDVIAFERLFLRGTDDATGRLIVELNLAVMATGSFPLNPDGLPLRQIDIDSDGEDESILLSEIALFVGAGIGGTPVAFEEEAGVPVVISAFWDMLDFNGNFIFDFDGDGDGDPANITNFPEFNCPVTGGWNGSLGISFVPDADPNTPDTTTGNMQTSQLRVTYLSNVATEFGFLCGDVNIDGQVTLLDIGPFVQLLSSQGFQIEADINEDGVVDLLDVSGFVDKISGL